MQTPRILQVLHSLRQGPRNVYEICKHIDRYHLDVSADTVSKCLKTLEDKGIVKHVVNDYMLTN